MGAWYLKYNEHLYTAQYFVLYLFLYFFFTSGQAPNFHVGNTNFENVWSVTFGLVITSNIQEALNLVKHTNYGKLEH